MNELRDNKRTEIKWYCDINGYYLFVSSSVDLYWFKDMSYIIKLNKELFRGKYVFRIPSTTKRFSKRTINKNAKACNILL